jgi:methionyl-tRNA formyltransferase
MALRIIFAASGQFAAPSLRPLLGKNHQIVRVISQPPRPAGRGKKLQPTPIAQLAQEHSLSLLTTENINQEKLEPADLLVVIAFGQKIAPHIVEHSRLGGINLHASVLPRYRGAAPINWAIIKGEAQTGNSVIRLAQKMDAGAILGQSQLDIGELETAGELHDRLAEDGAALLAKVVGELETGNAIANEQDEKLATLAPKLGRDDARIQWASDAIAIARRIRGLYPWPGCRARLTREGVEVARLTLVRARPLEQSGRDGVISPDGSVGAGIGSVEILEVQPEGKRPMPLSAYRNGHPWEAGMRLESL